MGEKKRRNFKLDIPELTPEQTHPELMKVQAFLNRLGYLQEAYEPERLDMPTQTALKRFQRFRKIKQTGRPDKSTVKKIKQPRCGLPDLDARDLFALEKVSDEIFFAAPATGLAVGCDYRPATTLTYTFVNRTSDLSANKVNDAIAKAFATWEAAIPIHFEFVEGDNSAKFKLSWVVKDHGDGQPFDDTGALIAHAFFPPICGGVFAGLCHFDEDERWMIGQNALQQRFDLQTVALHEIGHLLGLKHSTDRTSTMYPDYIFANDIEERRKLSPDAVTAIQSIYGSRH